MPPEKSGKASKNKKTNSSKGGAKVSPKGAEESSKSSKKKKTVKKVGSNKPNIRPAHPTAASPVAAPVAAPLWKPWKPMTTTSSLRQKQAPTLLPGRALRPLLQRLARLTHSSLRPVMRLRRLLHRLRLQRPPLRTSRLSTAPTRTSCRWLCKERSRPGILYKARLSDDTRINKA
ncbi:hypothetical protein L596_029088 [Steinernema carpocapsae]|uniref:Uncharacterized protein n=1 Tax=Steinernema carpocapsae TaxID=34508 RepID=A0A4U5LTL7_STECR|nr:hypothetical protein L596_029088 [Steinernema carpocapsae]